MSVTTLAVVMAAVLVPVEGNMTISLLFSALLTAMRIDVELYFELLVLITVCFVNLCTFRTKLVRL